MRASEARIIAEKNNFTNQEKQLKEIKEGIGKKSFGGKFEYIFRNSIYEENITALTLEGYIVKNVQTGYNEYAQSITW